MSWFGGIVLGLGAVLVAVLAAVKIMRIVRRRGGFPTKAAPYADRLDLDAENGAHDEINQMAEALIREHGPSAVIEAARRSISKLDDGDHVTQQTNLIVEKAGLIASDQNPQPQHPNGNQ